MSAFTEAFAQLSSSNVWLAGFTLAILCLVWLLNNREKINVKKSYNGPVKVPSTSTKPTVTKNAQLNGSLSITTEETSSFCNCKVKEKKGRFKELKIFYGTQTGTAKKFAEILEAEAQERDLEVSVVNLKYYDPEDSFASEAHATKLVVFIIATYTDGTPPECAQWFCKWLEESSTDFRVSKSLLKDMSYCVIGLGNSLYKENFCKVAKNVNDWLDALSAKRYRPIGLMNENVVESENGGNEADFDQWRETFWKNFVSSDCCGAGDNDGTKKSSDIDIEYETSSDENEEESSAAPEGGDVIDLEDLGSMMDKLQKAKNDKNNAANKEPREMITPLLRTSLEKQGYRLIGSHSGVKLCRWTKSMLRGRGGCYKHTFYGIESHRCMETTPSLACANKCVFCWRHHTNPVGTEWRWKMDDAKTIFQGAWDSHVGMIKQFRGVPGVVPERFQEGMTPQHCALSLVGEPIMYPEINKFIDLLHGKNISTFLVTNAQFPDAIRNLKPVTQLYVSVDASTKESLKKIDRPLFKDFWPRFLKSLSALSEKGQRTVFRLTLVKAWNTDELDNYAQLINDAKPDFIEIKGVTYCGESKASSLTMQNVPWHEEVVHFVQELADRLDDYEVASEHAHSNCVLIAQKKFKVNDVWHTWIDYPKFHQLLKTYEDTAQVFQSSDYMAPTPSWAMFGCQEQGFDPKETRHFRKKSNKTISDGGC